MRLATHFEPSMERLANGVRAPSKTLDRKDLKPGDEVHRAESAGQRSQASEPRTPQEADCHRADDLLRAGRSAP